MTDDDNFEYIRASLNTQEQQENEFKANDPFNKIGKNLKSTLA